MTGKNARQVERLTKVRKKSSNREQLRRDFYAAIDAEQFDLREAVHAFRLMLGMNQHEFAAYAEISPRILMAFEQGRGNPTMATVAKLLKGSGLILRPVRRRK